MGCRHSIEAQAPSIGVRVISINGQMEVFEGPVTAGEVAGKPPRHVLCSAAHLLSAGVRPLRPEDRLEPGRLYFLLPHSVLDAGPLDLAALATRLTTMARSAAVSKAKSEPSQTGPGPVRPHVWHPVLSTVQEADSYRSNASSSMKSPSAKH